MDEEIIEKFNERFTIIEDALKYIADSQAKSEFIRKQKMPNSIKKMVKYKKFRSKLKGI